MSLDLQPIPDRGPTPGAFHAWRLAQGWTKAQLAALFRVSAEAIWQWEHIFLPARAVAFMEQGALPPRRAKLRQPAHTGGADCRCPSCRARRAYATSRPWRGAPAPPWDAWTREHEARLRALVGTVELPEIARRLTAEFAVPRTPDAVRVRCTRLGLSTWAQAYSQADLTRLFGVGHRTITQYWVDGGHLEGRRWPGRGSAPGWWFEVAAVERFVRACGWLYDWRRMPPGHPLTRLAEVAHQRDPWCRYQDLARYVGLSTAALDRWRARGLIPHRRRPSHCLGGQIVVRGHAFWAIRAAIRTAQTAPRANRGALGEAR